MDIQKAQQLLEKYNAGACSPEEKALIEHWYFADAAARPMPEGPEDPLAEESLIWNKVKANLPEIQPARTRYLWRSVAAAASIILCLSFGSYFVYHRLSGVPQTAQRLEHAPGPATINNLIQLPDGSTVILEKDSKLSYAKSFKGKRLREVYLTGQAFFDIKHNPRQPFIVHSGKVKTTVLGTAFDVIARPGADEIVVRVIRGKVNVSTDKGSIGDLLPDKKVTYHVKEDQSSFASVNAKQEMQWTTQDMLLNDISFDGICKELEKRYNVKIDIRDDSLKNKKFTISLSAHENIDSFLKTVCDFNGATYKVNSLNNQFIITSIN